MTPSRARPDFTGVWAANLEKSSFRGGAPRELFVKIEHREPQLTQTLLVSPAAGGEERLRFEYATNGTESVNLVRGIPCKTRAHWDGAELVIETLMKTPDREFHFKDHWSLSDDGRTLTMAHRGDDLDGQVSVLERATPETASKLLDPSRGSN